MNDVFLALDQGGHASRALLFDGDGRIVRTAEEPIRTLGNAAGHIEHDAEELVASLRAAIGRVSQRLPAGTRVAAAGLATQRSSMACWQRETGEALCPVISWQDRRNAAWLDRLRPQAQRIRERTGLVLSPHYGASKMRWCLDHVAAVGSAARNGTLVMGPLASYLLNRLLDEKPLAADPANASRTQLWDPATGNWAADLLELFGIPAPALPRAVTSRYRFGTLTTPAGQVPLTVCTGDQSAVPFAFGALDAATAYVNAGTGAFVQRCVRDRMPAAPRLLASVVWSDESGVDYMLEGTVNGAGSALDWLCARDGLALPSLLAALASAPPASVPLFMNGVGGIGSPFWLSDFESRFIGDGEPVARLAAVLESIAFLLQVNIEEMRPHGPLFRQVLLTGGLSASDYFCRALASVSGLPILRSEEPEATAHGLARLVAGAVADRWPVPPSHAWTGDHDASIITRYGQWRKALDRCREDPSASGAPISPAGR
jgi:glycerol kinase